MYGGIAIEILEDVIRAMNQLQHQITYNNSSSTTAQDLLQHMTEGVDDSDIDCMLCISIYYYKQQHKVERPRPLLDNSALARDYTHNVLERPKQLSNFDLCLKHADADWRLPLVVRVHAHSTRNMRTRSHTSQTRRRERHAERGHGRQPGRQYQRDDDDRYYGPYARSSGSQ